MAVTGSCSVNRMDREGGGWICRWSWTSGSGTVTETGSISDVTGFIMSVKFIPSATAAPTNAYDVQLLDGNSVDILMGCGADLSSTVTSYHTPTNNDGFPVRLDNATLTPSISGAGTSKEGQIEMVVYR